ncbi:MAG: FecR domain-containing protein [Bacteroidota bacterium]
MPSKAALLQKFFDGTSTPAELEELFALLMQEDEPESEAILLQLAESMPPHPPLESSQQAHIWEQVSAQIEASKVRPFPVRTEIKWWHNSMRLGSMAAGFLLLALAGWWLLWGSGPAERFYQTEAGEVLELVLPDSSLVTLNGNSSLRFAERWTAAETRTVKLSGEAYFEVKPKPATQAKFHVKTAELTVEVLGTAFNVNSRQAQTKVFLDEGKITVKLAALPEVKLKPGELLSYSLDDAQSLLTRQDESELHTSWKSGVLVFKDSPLEEIVRKLEAANDIHIDIKDKNLKTTRFTFGLPIKDMQVTRSVLERMTGGKLIPQADHYVLTKNN